MKVGRVLAGRFRIRQPLPQRLDRQCAVAIDEVTRQVVTVHIGSRGLARDAELARISAGRGALPVLGLWQDGHEVVLVCERREPVVPLTRRAPAPPRQVLSWLADVASALERFHAEGHVHGNLDLDRVTVLGDHAWIDLTGPRSSTRPVSADLRVLSELVHGALDRGTLRLTDRGMRALLRQLPPDEPESWPRTAGAVRVAAERVLARRRRSPGRLRSIPVGLRSTAVVLARPDGAGGWAACSPSQTVRAARRTARLWQAAGADTRVVRRGLGVGDVMWMTLAAAMCGVLLPVVGLAVGGVLMARHRTARCRPGAGRDLPLLPDDPTAGWPDEAAQ